MRLGLVVPHIFMHRSILPEVIFSPGMLALDLANGLQKQGVEVTLFTPGPVDTTVKNVTADLRLFENELLLRRDNYLDLLKKHPFTFVTLARQVQSEIIARAFEMANRDMLDIIHIYTNEEDIALPFAQFCKKPVVFTHHDPFNFLVKYKNIFPKYPQHNWLSLSFAQRRGMPETTNWVANIYHGLDEKKWVPNYSPPDNYVTFVGRIIEPKGTHLAIKAVQQYNAHTSAQHKLKLKIAGKHYADHQKDAYWRERITPLIDGDEIKYVGHIKSMEAKQILLGNARALIVPSIFEEPFGMVVIEALACGTPIIALDSGALPELIQEGASGVIAQKVWIERNSSQTDRSQHLIDEDSTINNLVKAIQTSSFDRRRCRQAFEARFTLERVCREHIEVFKKLITH